VENPPPRERGGGQQPEGGADQDCDHHAHDRDLDGLGYRTNEEAEELRVESGRQSAAHESGDVAQRARIHERSGIDLGDAER
jgi:hypothetical protein